METGARISSRGDTATLKRVQTGEGGREGGRELERPHLEHLRQRLR
jgi:hypothetical protein